MERPRARTQSGNATCADTFKLANTAIQEAPAIKRMKG